MVVGGVSDPLRAEIDAMRIKNTKKPSFSKKLGFLVSDVSI
jgi:hypothetical protein